LLGLNSQLEKAELWIQVEPPGWGQLTLPPIPHQESNAQLDYLQVEHLRCSNKLTEHTGESVGSRLPQAEDILPVLQDLIRCCPFHKRQR